MPELREDLIETFIWYIRERESIRLRKEVSKLPRPWTDDPILHRYSFTNVKRSNDRTSRWIFNNWLEPHQYDSVEAQLLNCAIARWFGDVDFLEAAGWSKDLYEPRKLQLIQVAEDRISEKERNFTSAYVVTNGGIPGPKHLHVLAHYLTPLWENIPAIVDAGRRLETWEGMARRMAKVHGHGGNMFMTKEIMLDFLAIPSNPIPFTDRDTWTPVGPGGYRGLQRLFEGITGRSNDLIGLMEVLRQRVSEEIPDSELNITDIQFNLCEFDKYMRTKLGEGRPRRQYGSNH